MKFQPGGGGELNDKKPIVEVLKSGEFHDCGFFGELRLQNCEEESYIKVGVIS